MRSAILVALLSVAACKGKHEKETVIITNNPPNTAVADPTAPLPAGNPSVNTPPSAPASAQGSAAAAAPGPADTQPSAPVQAAPTGGTMTQPAARALPDAGVVPDAIDTNGLMPEH